VRTDFQLRKFVTHSKRILTVARGFGWFPGARYTNLRDVRTFTRIGFLDIDFKNYDFSRHLEAVKQTLPWVTVARDIHDASDLPGILRQAERLAQYCRVIVVPKDLSLAGKLKSAIPKDFLLGYSVPTAYGGTPIPPQCFKRPVHLLGGRPDIQRRLAEQMPVISLDCNRFTLDAAFGDFFDGETFRPHPAGGYEKCVRDSLRNINRLWASYVPHFS
jgi:hypothetical protein